MPKVLRFRKGLLIFPLLALLLACEREQPTDTTIGPQGNTPATDATIFANARGPGGVESRRPDGLRGCTPRSHRCANSA